MNPTSVLRATAMAVVLLTGSTSRVTSAQVPAPATAAPSAPGILSRDQAAAILPPSVFFRGQSAAIQGRNSSGVRLKDGKLVLAAAVDTSGYSSGTAETYQAYLLTEVPLMIADHRLAPGAYGFGFVAGQIVVMDIGGNEVLRGPAVRDSAIARPTPLQILAHDTGYRLYMGRTYVAFSPAGSR